MPRIIALSGHGSWELGSSEFVRVPANTTIHFYTLNMKTLSDAFGGDLDRGIVKGAKPDQTGAAFTNVPNMHLFPPDGLNIREPDRSTWEVVKLRDASTPVLPGPKNVQIQIDPSLPDGLDLESIFNVLSGCLLSAKENLVVWAACRAVNLKASARGERIGVNALQR